MNLQEEIAKVAYELYLRRGCAHGHDLDDWLEAERIVLARHAGQEIEEPEVEVSAEEGEVISETMPTAEAEETVIEETETPIVEEPKKKGRRRKTTKKVEEKPKRPKKTTGKRPRKKE
ncbi:MAG: DUF2934 domain-containing protein [Thermodesulfovibrionales bacterium]